MLRFVAAAAAALVCFAANAGPTQILRDINKTIQTGIPQPFGSSWIAMLCRNGPAGQVCNPWITDGTTAGTHIVKSISTDLEPQSFGGIVVVGSNAYMVARRGTNTTLWRTDGTDAGTVSVSIPTNAYPTLGAANGLVFFSTSDTGALWRSDGTAAGTYAVVSSGVGSWSAATNSVYFGYDDGVHGYELWMTDGTAAGTALVKDINAGSSGSGISMIGAGAGHAFFWAHSTDLASSTLWSSDGTDAGTIEILGVNVPTSLTPFVAFNGKVALLTYANNTTGLVVSDGTVAGTQVVQQFTGLPNLYALTAAGPAVLFLVGSTIWRSDGTSAGTLAVQYFDVSPPQFSNAWAIGTEGDARIGLGPTFYFKPRDVSAYAYELSATGAASAHSMPWALGGIPYGIAGDQLLLSNGVIPLDAATTVQPLQVMDGQPSNSANCGQSNAAVLAGSAYFLANDGINGCQLWKTDGTSTGTSAVTSKSSQLTVAGSFFVAGPWLYFMTGPDVVSQQNGAQLWRTDGTTMGFVKDFSTGGILRGFAAAGSSLVFGVDGDVWRMDAAGTQPTLVTGGFRVATVLTGDAGGAYFYGEQSVGGQLYRYDLANGVTATGKAANPSPSGFANAGNTVVFVDGTNNAYSIWRSDGTPGGTYALLNASRPVGILASVGPRVFFTANGYLWRTDGTAAGTTALAQVSVQLGWVANDQSLWFNGLPGGSGNPVLYRVGAFDAGVTMVGPGGESMLTPVGAYSAVMLAGDTAHGNELWLSRGDPPSLLEDFEPGTASNFVSMIDIYEFKPIALGNKVVLMTSHNGTGWEPYVIDIPAPGPATAMLDRVDFDGNHDADIVLRDADGSVQVQTMTGTTATATSAPMTGVGGASGRVISTAGDFNGDGNADLLFQRDDGGIEMWLMNGASRLQATIIMNPTGWSVAHIADFDGDGKSDILWKNTDGSVGLWLMDGVVVRERGMILAPGSAWVPEHVGDFNGDGRADILWRNGDGSIAMWLMYGLAVVDHGGIMPAATGWDVLHVADFDGDGKSDLLWQHTDGTVSIWTMNGLTTVTHAPIMPANTSWTVTHVADFNGDGKADLVWLARDGTVGMWLMNGTTQLERKTLMPAGTGWTVTLAQDLDGDNKADLVWSHPSGAAGGWIMNGTTNVSRSSLQSSGSTNTVVPLRFQH